jgi:hypothetical protein
MRIRNPKPELLRATGESARVASWNHPFHESDANGHNTDHDRQNNGQPGVTMRLPVLQREGATA